MISTADLFDLYNATLEMLCCPIGEYPNLEELEGDAHTFLHEKNLSVLLNSGYINQAQYDSSLRIHDIVNDIADEHWNRESFFSYHRWIEARELAKGIMRKI